MLLLGRALLLGTLMLLLGAAPLGATLLIPPPVPPDTHAAASNPAERTAVRTTGLIVKRRIADPSDVVSDVPASFYREIRWAKTWQLMILRAGLRGPHPSWANLAATRPQAREDGAPCHPDTFELICGQFGDHIYLDYSEIPPWLQRIRGH